MQRYEIKPAGRHRASRIADGPHRTYAICWLGYSQTANLDRKGGKRALWSGGIPRRDCPRPPMNLAPSASYAAGFGVPASRRT